MATKREKRSDKWLAQQIGLSEANQRFRDVCEQIKSDGNWPDSGDAEGWDFALHEARKYIGYEERRGQRVRRQRDLHSEVETKLAASESRRANALMLFWAKHAASVLEVRRFRERLLGNNLLSMSEAYTFLRSPALQIFSQSELERAGVPVVGHSAILGSRIFKQRVVQGSVWQLTVHIEQPDIELSCKRLLTKPVNHLQFAGEDEWGNTIDVWPDSVISDLQRASEGIAKNYRWEEEQAAVFILTGIVPLVHPLSYSIQERSWETSVITITYYSWITEETVRRAHREAQRKVYDKAPGSVGLKNAAVFEFIVERLDGEGNRPPWRKLMDEWNRMQQQDDRKYVSVQNFRRDFDRAESSFLKPQLAVHPPKQFEDMTPAEQIVETIRKYTNSENDDTDSYLDS